MGGITSKRSSSKSGASEEKGESFAPFGSTLFSKGSAADESFSRPLGHSLMLRQPKSKYEHKRSNTLLKVKTFYDAEARVVRHEPGKVSLAEPPRAGLIRPRRRTLTR